MMTPQSFQDEIKKSLAVCVTAGQSFDLHVWSKLNQVKKSTADDWQASVQARIGFTIEDADDNILPFSSRISMYIKSVYAPSVVDLIDSGYRITILDPANLRSIIHRITHPSNVEDLLQRAAAWSISQPEVEKQFKRGVTVIVDLP